MRNTAHYLAIALAAFMASSCEGQRDADASLVENAEATSTHAVITADLCSVAVSPTPLPDQVRETSGLALGRRNVNAFWTHNDAGNDPDLFAVSSSGALLAQVRVQGAELVDWEDIEAGACEEGSCLYVGDIGDNDGERETITIYEIPEPALDARTVTARALPARFPDGPRDSEALFAMPSGDLYVVTKGREGPIAIYRYPSPHRPGETVTLERVRELGAEPRDQDDRITSATSTADGRWVGIRSYRTLQLYPAASLLGTGPLSPTRVDLAPLGERQGESLVVTDDGTIWTTSEAEKKGDSPTLAGLKCTLGTPAR